MCKTMCLINIVVCNSSPQSSHPVVAGKCAAQRCFFGQCPLGSKALGFDGAIFHQRGGCVGGLP